eukprot:COSAG04_NODE_26753_length_291_cov_0.802083_1_plen_83_part_10
MLLLVIVMLESQPGTVGLTKIALTFGQVKEGGGQARTEARGLAAAGAQRTREEASVHASRPSRAGLPPGSEQVVQRRGEPCHH